MCTMNQRHTPNRSPFHHPLRRTNVVPFDRTMHRLPAYVPERTGPLDVFEGQRVLVIADVQNLTAGASQFGCKFSYGHLAQLLRSMAKSSAFHAFFATGDVDTYRSDYFRNRGWAPYPYQVHFVDTCRGTERRSNVDTMLACVSGALVRCSNADVLALCSGDGSLVSDIAQSVKLFPKRRSVVTISLAGSTAYTLDSSRNPLIAANVECGRDVLHQMEARRWA